MIIMGISQISTRWNGLNKIAQRQCVCVCFFIDIKIALLLSHPKVNIVRNKEESLIYIYIYHLCSFFVLQINWCQFHYNNQNRLPLCKKFQSFVIAIIIVQWTLHSIESTLFTNFPLEKLKILRCEQNEKILESFKNELELFNSTESLLFQYTLFHSLIDTEPSRTKKMKKAKKLCNLCSTVE